MLRIKEVKSVVSVFVLTLILSGAVLATGALAHEEPPAPEPEPSACTSLEGVPCSTTCGPTQVGEFKAGGAHYIEMVESRQVNMLSGTKMDFSAPCIPGYFAVSGVYNVLPEGTTIDLDEIRMVQKRADNDQPQVQNSWVATVYRVASDNVDNCVNVEVRATCVK